MFYFETLTTKGKSMSFVKDLITLSPREIRTRFSVGKGATGIYDSKEVMNFLIADDKDLIFPKDMSKNDIKTYLAKRKQLNTFIAFIIYHQTFTTKKVLLRSKKSKESLDFLTRSFIYPDNFEDDTAFNMVFAPIKFEYNQNTANGLTHNQASAMCAVAHLKLYIHDLEQSFHKGLIY